MSGTKVKQFVKLLSILDKSFLNYLVIHTEVFTRDQKDFYIFPTLCQTEKIAEIRIQSLDIFSWDSVSKIKKYLLKN